MKWLINLLTGGVLSRILSTVDKSIEAKTDREALKADIIKSSYENRAGFMKAGGFTLMLLFAVPLALWFSSVIVYSMFWCQGCMYPQPWSIAALPEPLSEWAGIIIISIFGVVGVTNFKGSGK